MALEDLTPSNRIESILDGDNITPSNRLEYFLKKAAATELPTVEAADAGKVLTVSESGNWAAATPTSGLTLYGPYYATWTSSFTTSNPIVTRSLSEIFRRVYDPDTETVNIIYYTEPYDTENVNIFQAGIAENRTVSGGQNNIYAIQLNLSDWYTGGSLDCRIYCNPDYESGYEARGMYLVFFSDTEFPELTE